MTPFQRTDRIRSYYLSNDIPISWKHYTLMKYIEPYRSMIYGSTRSYTYNLDKLNAVMRHINFFAILVYTGYQHQGEFVGFYLDTTFLHYHPETIMKITEHDIAYNYTTANILRLPIDFIVKQKCDDISRKRRRMIQEKLLRTTLLTDLSMYLKHMSKEPQCRYANYIFRVVQSMLLPNDDPHIVESMNTVRQQLKSSAYEIISKHFVHLPIYERIMTRRYHPENGYIEESMKEFSFVG